MVAATLPWVVLLLALAWPRSEPPATETATPLTSPTEQQAQEVEQGDEHDQHASTSTAPPSADLPAAHDDRAGSRDTRGQGAVDVDPAAGAVALAVSRAWLTDAGPDLALEGVEPDRRAYLEHALVRSVERVGQDLAVATVTAVLLDRDGDRYGEVRVRDLLVPLRLTDQGPRPAGAPWWAATSVELAVARAPAEPIDDADATASVEEALRAAGYRDVEVASLASLGPELAVVELTATTADGEPIDGEMWVAVDGRVPTPLGVEPDLSSTPDLSFAPGPSPAPGDGPPATVPTDQPRPPDAPDDAPDDPSGDQP